MIEQLNKTIKEMGAVYTSVLINHLVASEDISKQAEFYEALYTLVNKSKITITKKYNADIAISTERNLC